MIANNALGGVSNSTVNAAIAEDPAATREVLNVGEISDGIPTNYVVATLITALVGTNNDIRFTAQTAGEDGNQIKISIFPNEDPSLNISVIGNNIYIAHVLDTTTASEIITAVNNHPQASLLVYAQDADGNNGSGTMGLDVLLQEPLSGGVDGTPGVIGDMKVAADTLYVVSELNYNTPSWKQVSLAELS